MRTTLLLLFALTAHAPAADPPSPAAPPPAFEILTEQPLAKHHNPLGFDLIAGLPTALRVSYKLPERRIWLEAGIGMYTFAPAAFVGTAFVGLRGEGLFLESEHHDFAVRPGLDFYYMHENTINNGKQSRGYNLFDGEMKFPTIYGGAVDMEMIWRIRWAKGFHGTTGLKLGLGMGYKVDERAWTPLPILGLTFGCNF